MFSPQFAALVGTGDAGLMSPAPSNALMNPSLAPFGNYAGPGGYPGMACSPCGPSPALQAARAEAYERFCAEQQAMTAMAARIAIMKELPTVAAPANSVTTVLAGATETITVTSPVPLCIIDWDVSRNCSSFFTAVSLVCALVPYLVTAGEMQLDVFASDAIHPTTNFPQIIPGTPAVLVVHNISADPHPFFSVFHGIRGPGQGPCLGYNQGLYGGAW
jgi:hypothetical protein